MSRRSLKYNPGRARVPLDATNAGPYLKLAACIAVLAAFILLVAFVLVPSMIRWFQTGIVWNPAPVRSPAPTVQPQDSIGSSMIREFPFDPALGINAILDPSVHGGSLLFVAGADTSVPNRLIRYDLTTGETQDVAVTIHNDAVRMPAESARYLVYFDQKSEGGGSVRVIDKALRTDTAVCDVRFGVPRLFVEAQYLVFTERTDVGAYRVNAVDLGTMESVAIAVIEDDDYGVSLPSLASGQALYAARNADRPAESVIESVRLDTGAPFTFDPGTYVHDPKSNGDCWAWMTGNHDGGSALYLSERGGAPMLIARGIADFYILRTALVYCRDEAIYAYAFSDGRTYVLSEAGVKAQLLTAMNGYVVWRDVTDPADVRYKFLKAT